jgi:hypothetical protein
MKATELKLKEIEIYMGLFDFNITCVIGDFDQTLKYVAWKFEDEELDGNEINKGYEPRGKCFMRRGYVPIMWLPKRPTKPRELATLAHEAIHAALFMFDWASVPQGADTEEVLGHTVGHIVNEILASKT